MSSNVFGILVSIDVFAVSFGLHSAGLPAISSFALATACGLTLLIIKAKVKE